MSLKKQEDKKYSVSAARLFSRRLTVTPPPSADRKFTHRQPVPKGEVIKKKFVKIKDKVGYGKDLKETFKLRFTLSEFRLWEKGKCMVGA